MPWWYDATIISVVAMCGGGAGYFLRMLQEPVMAEVVSDDT